MEFEELQKIWDAPTNQTLYVVNETALHKRILTKKNKTLHITWVTELLLIIVNIAAGCFVFANAWIKDKLDIFLVILATWMWLAAIYVLVNRVRRIKAALRFDRSMLGDLEHAVSTATYQVRISYLSLCNALLLLLYCVALVLQSGKSIWYAVALGAVFFISWRAGNWEHNIYKRRKRELEQLLHKLQQEGNGE